MKLVGNTKSEYIIKTGKFKNLDGIMQALNNAQKNMDDELEQAAAHDARLYIEKLAENYAKSTPNYAAQKLEGFWDPEFAQFGYTKQGGEYYGIPKIYATHTKDGFTVGISGKDILYQEFGTGTPGEESRYPLNRAKRLGMDIPYPFGEKYKIGEHIMHHYRYINSNQLFGQKIPAWYVRAIKQGIIEEDDYAWLGPLGVTIGTPAGRFVYDTDDWYLNQREKARYVESDIRLGKRTFTRNFKKKYFD